MNREEEKGSKVRRLSKKANPHRKRRECNAAAMAFAASWWRSTRRGENGSIANDSKAKETSPSHHHRSDRVHLASVTLVCSTCSEMVKGDDRSIIVYYHSCYSHATLRV